MKLVRVVDLVGVDVNGLRADVRPRNSDGSLTYEHTKDTPRLVTMKMVERKQNNIPHSLQRKCGGKTRGTWLYWSWEKNFDAIPFDCGFSGVLIEGPFSTPRNEYILLENRS